MKQGARRTHVITVHWPVTDQSILVGPAYYYCDTPREVWDLCWLEKEHLVHHQRTRKEDLSHLLCFSSLDFCWSASWTVSVQCLLCQSHHNVDKLGQEVMGSCCTREVQVGCWEKFLLRKSGDALAQTAQGGERVMVPGSAQEKGWFGIEEHGLEQSQTWADGWTRWF